MYNSWDLLRFSSLSLHTLWQLSVHQLGADDLDHAVVDQAVGDSLHVVLDGPQGVPLSLVVSAIEQKVQSLTQVPRVGPHTSSLYSSIISSDVVEQLP